MSAAAPPARSCLQSAVPLAAAAESGSRSGGSGRHEASSTAVPDVCCSYPACTDPSKRPAAGIVAAVLPLHAALQQALDGWRCLMFSIEKLPGGTNICTAHADFWRPFV